MSLEFGLVWFGLVWDGSQILLDDRGGACAI